MLAATALLSVKNKLDIPTTNTTFDVRINADVLDAVKRMFPMAQHEANAQTVTVSPSGGRAEIDLSALPTPLEGVRRIEVNNSSAAWTDHTDTYQHGTFFYIDELDSDVGSVKLYGLDRYTLANLAAELELAVVLYACSAFYQYLLGNKRKFNIYTQAAGARSADDMRDQATYYENNANVYLADRATMYGAS